MGAKENYHREGYRRDSVAFGGGASKHFRVYEDGKPKFLSMMGCVHAISEIGSKRLSGQHDSTR